MKILVLTPLDKSIQKPLMDIWLSLPKELQSVSLPMGLYNQWLTETKVADGIVEGTIYSFVAAEKVYDENIKNGVQNFIIFGNISKDYEFDAIFNFQYNKNEQYRDTFLEAVKECIKPAEGVEADKDADYVNLMKHIGNTYTAKDSLLCLQDIEALTDFLQKYIKTNAFDELIEKYKKKFTETKTEGKNYREAKKVVETDGE